MALLQKAASDAVAEQQRVQTKLGEQEQKNIQLRTDLETATVESQAKIELARAEAAREIGKVQKDVALQQERAAKAEKDLLELQVRTRPRNFTPEQREAILRVLREQPGCTVRIEFANLGEPISHANALREMLDEAGWNRSGFEPTKDLFADKGDTGLMIVTQNPESTCFLTLRKALSVLGFVSTFVDQKMLEGSMALLVGEKPAK